MKKAGAAQGMGEHVHTTRPSGPLGRFLPRQGFDLHRGPWPVGGKRGLAAEAPEMQDPTFHRPRCPSAIHAGGTERPAPTSPAGGFRGGVGGELPDARGSRALGN